MTKLSQGVWGRMTDLLKSNELDGYLVGVTNLLRDLIIVVLAFKHL